MGAFYVALTGFEHILKRFMTYVNDFATTIDESAKSYIAIMQYYKGNLNEAEIGSHVNGSIEKAKNKLVQVNAIYTSGLPNFRDFFLLNGLYLMIILIIVGVENSKENFIYFPVIVINTITLIFFIVLFIKFSKLKLEKERLSVSQILLILFLLLIIYHVSVFIFEKDFYIQSFCFENQLFLQKLSVFSSLLLSGIAYLLLFLKYLFDWKRINKINKLLRSPSQVLKEAADSYFQKNFKDILKQIRKPVGVPPH
jgi:hypothetical protein